MKATWRTTADEPASAILRRLHGGATPGPWTYVYEDVIDGGVHLRYRDVHGWCGGCNHSPLQTGDPECARIAALAEADFALLIALRNALPALADLVEYVEKVATQPCHWMPMHEPGDDIRNCNPCEARRALAALRERLEQP